MHYSYRPSSEFFDITGFPRKLNFSQVWGVYRTAQKTRSIDAVNIPVNTTVFASIKEANASVHPFLLLVFSYGRTGQKYEQPDLRHWATWVRSLPPWLIS